MDELFDNDPREAAPGGSDGGNILTSTLWAQYGTVYVAVDGEQTALTGYTYDRFSPFDENGSRSRAGCSNIADAQIIYYWIGKGYDFQLSVTADDCFKIMEGSTPYGDLPVYYVSDTAHAGEGTLSEINAILGASERIGNGEFIEALIYFCGVKNRSVYGPTTVTSWSTKVSTTGNGAKAFVAAGFDSYYFIARNASGPEPELFFTGTDGLTEVCLSILRENLDYGEPLRIGIPGHAVYMDGWRVNPETGEYEYHLNYGWGINSTSNKWYTVSDLESITVKYVNIDISPDVTVNVSNARGDYYGGSFLRGMERINHIVNDKSTTFSFDSGLAGETIVLSAVAEVKSEVDVEFMNIGVSLATTASELFNSARGMSFDVSGGSLIVSSASAEYAIRETGSSAVNVTVNGGFIYIGDAVGGISAVQGTLRADGGYRFGDFDAEFYASVGGCAVKSGSAADTVSLERGAALFGKLDLGAGDNLLDIGAGSLFYGGFAGAANTLTVNLSVDAATGSGATAALADAASAEAFHAATGGVLNLDLGALTPGRRSYDLLYGADSDFVRLFAVNLSVRNGAEELGTLEVGERLVAGKYACFLEVASGALTLTVENVGSGDLDGDGRADVLMTVAQSDHPACGATGAWLIQSDQTAAWGDLSQRGDGWEIFGAGFTTAGKATADVYLKSADNVVGAWVTDATGKVAAWQTVGEFDASTRVLGLGDFDGDGRTDLLLRNDNGAVGCHFTNGTGWNYFQSLGDEWSICAVGDLDGDGRDDVVLKHDAGFAGGWLTQADGTMAWADLDTLSAGFEIVGCGDFDGDGTDDVLLQKGSYFGAWLVRDGGVSGWMGLGDLAATVEEIADFDDDGIDDLRIRTAAGDLGALLVKGEDALQWRYYGSVGSEWSTRSTAL